MVAIIGSNGTGKTTLLNIICGLLAPDSGTVLIDGCMFNKPTDAYKLRTMIGFAPDTPPLYPQDTITSYLRFIAELKQIPKNQIQTRIDACLEIFDLKNIAHNYIHTLSKGLQQRVNLAQAIIHEPKILLLDEPTNGLDADQNDAFKEYLHKLQQRNVTIIYASHNYSDLLAISDYMLKVTNGKLEKILLPARIPKDVKVYDHADYTT